MRVANGETRWVTAWGDFEYDSAGQPVLQVGAMQDINERKAAAGEIEHLAFYDPLTGLPNRRLLLDRLRQAVASSTRTERHGALLFLDLDNFKALNDTLGHDIGDLLLQQVAQRLVGCVREGDTVARLGGDEFVLMLEDLSENSQEAATQTESVGEKILAVLNQPYQLEAQRYHNTPSIGVTLFVDHDGSVDELMKRADMAMYQAKAAGRNTLRFFDPVMQAEVTTRVALEADLREAVLKGQFVLHYQAQVAGDGRLTGTEVLLRWNHPQRGLVSPMEFIPLAEETGLILPMGLWVLQTACAQLAAWAARPDMAHLSIAVNVSACQLHHVDFVAQVLAVLDSTGARPQRLKLELTESLLVKDVEGVIAKMTALKARGVGFSLDDFGTGYSSLTYFLNLPVQLLKIDQSFVRVMLEDPGGLGIVESVVRLAQAFNRPVIAEGVETLEHGSMLLYLGCYLAQGYGISRPMPADQVGPWLQAWKADQSWRRMVTPAVDQDVTLQVAAQSHRAWVDKVTRQVTQLDGDSIIEADSNICSFGRWYRGSGVTRYGSAPQYKDIAVHHERGHELAGIALTLAKSGKRQEADLVLQELYESCDSMVALLKKLISKPAIWR